MYTEYEEEYNNNNFNNTKKGNYKLIIIIIGIILLGIIGFIIYNTYSNSYKNYENKLKKAAKSLVSNYTSLSFVDNYTLGVTLKDTCKGNSGVFIENGNIYPYLVCDDYKTDIFEDTSSYSLNGDKIMFIPVGYNYVELGVNNLNNVTSSGILNTSLIGVYKLSYNVSDGNLSRYVIVTDNVEISSLYPKISLKGDSLETLIRLNTYTDSGIYAYDNVDGDISSKVIKTGTVNSNVAGEYKITYQVTNSRGYSSYAVRKITVVDGEKVSIVNSDISNLSTINSVSVDFIITGDNFEYAVLPNGKYTYDRVFTYDFTDNGNYKVVCYSIDNSSVEKSYNISTIIKEFPSGSCTLDNYYSYAKISVSATSPSGILSYKYKYNGKESDLNSTSLTLNNVSIKSASVIVTNKLGGATELNCSVKDYSSDATKLLEVKSYRKTYNNSFGKQCLSGFVCINQDTYTKTGKYTYCSSNTENSCGSMAQHGCSIISFAQILSGYVRKDDGSAYTPYEIFEKHSCSKNCSGFSNIKRMAEAFGLTTSGKAVNNVVANKSKIIEYLKKGAAIEVRIGSGGTVYIANKTGGHLMAILAYDEENDMMFLADTHGADLTRNKYPVNQWIKTDDCLKYLGKTGSAYLAIGPVGTI